MSPELKLKTAAEEIKDILRKYDIAASIALHTPGHGEFLNHILTSYSCAYQYEDDSIRFYSNRKDFESTEAQLKGQESTSNMMHVLAKLTGENFMMLHEMSQKFDHITNAEHF